MQTQQCRVAETATSPPKRFRHQGCLVASGNPSFFVMFFASKEQKACHVGELEDNMRQLEDQKRELTESLHLCERQILELQPSNQA